MKGRFAPSPTGRMHLGNIYSALLAWLSARSQDGGFILRIEDIDRQRSRDEYAVQIDADLRWLGIDWDERYVQSRRFTYYEDHLKRLNDMGLVYPCYCSRADIMATQAPHESDGRVVYKGTCRPENLPHDFMPSRPGALRLRVPDSDISFVDGHYGEHSVDLSRQCGDFILRRADGAWAYQLAVVVDDALMGVTEIVRGSDLLLSVPQQMYLYGLFGYETPSYCHLPLLCNAEGQRLSKRDKSLDMSVLRDNYRPEELTGLLAYYAGITDRPEGISARELIPLFSWRNVPVGNIRLCSLPTDISLSR